jgi:transposase
LSQRWPEYSHTIVRAKGTGRANWQGIRATVTPASAVGVAGDEFRQWIPTRENQPREEDFDKKTYRKRNTIERTVNWHKEYRALGTRYEKLATNYVALWLVAIIDKALKRLLPHQQL